MVNIDPGSWNWLGLGIQTVSSRVMVDGPAPIYS